MLRRILIALAVVLFVTGAAGAWFWWHVRPSPTGEAYVGLGGSPLWDGTGQVRRLVEQLSWGEQLSVLDHYGDSVEVRTRQGTIGWVDEDVLIKPGDWKRLEGLEARTQEMAVQAPGHTRVLSNLRLDPGRGSPRIGQLRRNTPVAILARGVAGWEGGGGGQEKKEGWLLVRARTASGNGIAGWALEGFIEEELPDPLAAYATSSGVSPVAWFTLRKLMDPRAGAKPYYLLAGTSGPEGQPCDFTRISVYTWSVARGEYETSFTQGDLCGRLPIRVTFAGNPQEDAGFTFQNLQPSGEETLTYRMRSTIVSRIRAPGSEGGR